MRMRNYSSMSMDAKRYEIRIGGSGGQGIITTGILLGEAATLYDHRYAVQTQSYGPEARGGASKTDVVLSTEPINYPKVLVPDLIAVLSKEAYKKYSGEAGPDTILVVDSGCIEPGASQRAQTIAVPICETALKEMGSALTTNILVLGFIIGISDAVSYPAVELAVATRFASKKPALNIKALKKGYDMAQEYRVQGGIAHASL